MRSDTRCGRWHH